MGYLGSIYHPVKFLEGFDFSLHSYQNQAQLVWEETQSQLNFS